MLVNGVSIVPSLRFDITFGEIESMPTEALRMMNGYALICENIQLI